MLEVHCPIGKVSKGGFSYCFKFGEMYQEYCFSTSSTALSPAASWVEGLGVEAIETCRDTDKAERTGVHVVRAGVDAGLRRQLMMGCRPSSSCPHRQDI